MARRRMIDPNIWQSNHFRKLNMMSRVLFIGMFSNADDEGRGRAEPAYLRSMVFPYDEDITLNDIKAALENISKWMSIQFYTIDDSHYYSFPNWQKWQTINRPQPSFLPAPPRCKETESAEIVDINDFEHSKNLFNESFNESFNDCSMNHSRLKEKKGKEINIKENKRSTFVGAISDETTPNRQRNEKIICKMPLKDKTEYEITQEEADKLASLYPKVDIKQEFNSMIGWLDANPDRLKTRKGIKRFINGWLSKEQKEITEKEQERSANNGRFAKSGRIGAGLTQKDFEAYSRGVETL